MGWIFWTACYENDSKNEVAVVCRRDYHHPPSSAGNLDWTCLHHGHNHLYHDHRHHLTDIPLVVKRSST